MIIFLAVLALLVCHLDAAPNAHYGNSRIVGGKNVTIEQYPYNVQIVISGNAFACNGAIVSNAWVVTTARCIPTDPTTIQIRAGTSDFGVGGSVHTATKALTHPQFQGGSSYNYDVGLISVTPNLAFSTAVQPVRLPEANRPPAESGVVTGWGTDNPDSPNSSSKVLQTAAVNIMDRYDCDKYSFGNTTFCSTINENSPCGQADYGDPLVAHSALIGILSVPTCQETLAPDVYTEVGKIRDWISSTTGV